MNGLDQVVGCIVDALNDVGVTLGVGGPEYNNLI
jgi:hypothetical protein